MSNRWNYPEKVKGMKFKEKHQNQVFDRLQRPNKPEKTFGRLWMAAAVVVLLFVGLLFTPAMEPVVAKIPYISQFIEKEEDRMERMEVFFDEAYRSIQDEGYQIGNMQVSHEDKEVIVELIDMDNGKDEVRIIVEELLKEKNFHEYAVSVEPFEERVHQSDVTEEEMQQLQQDSKDLEEKVTDRLKEENFELMFPVQVQMNPTQGVYIHVIVSETETRLSLLENILLEEGQEYNENPELDIRQVENKARAQEIRWGETGAIHHIAQAMMESDQYPVTGFSYSFHPYPLQIKIKTSLDRSDGSSKQIAEAIRDEIDLFIQTGEKTAPIRNDEYEVHVFSEDKKNIQ